MGAPVAGGYLHPLLKVPPPPPFPPPPHFLCPEALAAVAQVRTQFKKIFTQMGFEEMPTNNFVESSFWNFDALFQPQQHPARDAHDTFFLTSTGPLLALPRGSVCSRVWSPSPALPGRGFTSHPSLPSRGLQPLSSSPFALFLFSPAWKCACRSCFHRASSGRPSG